MVTPNYNPKPRIPKPRTTNLSKGTQKSKCRLSSFFLSMRGRRELQNDHLDLLLVLGCIPISFPSHFPFPGIVTFSVFLFSVSYRLPPSPPPWPLPACSAPPVVILAIS